MTIKLDNYQNCKLKEKIQNNQSHSRIDLRKENLSDADIEFIIREGIIRKQCSMLWFTDNQLTPTSVCLLASALETNTNLEGLSLCSNGLTDDEILPLVQSLSTNQSNLKRLALTSNKLTDQGAEHLAGMLKLNKSLTQLWLGYNRITDDGVKVLLNTLTHYNITLHVLSLSSNPMITDKCIDFFLDMFEQNNTLKMVSLLNCNLSEAGKDILRQAAKIHREFYFDL